MAQQLLNTDVPTKLVQIARQIDISAYSPKERQLNLEKLEALADKYIPIRRSPIRQVSVYDIHEDLVEVLNKYDFTKVGRLKMTLAEQIIVPWVKVNLKLKK